MTLSTADSATRDEITRLLKALLAEVEALRRDANRRETDAQQEAFRRRMMIYLIAMVAGSATLTLAAIGIATGLILAAM